MEEILRKGLAVWIIAFNGSCPLGSDKDFYDNKDYWGSAEHNKGYWLGERPPVFFAFLTKEKRDEFYAKYQEAFDHMGELCVPDFPATLKMIDHHRTWMPVEENKVFTWTIRRR